MRVTGWLRRPRRQGRDGSPVISPPNVFSARFSLCARSPATRCPAAALVVGTGGGGSSPERSVARASVPLAAPSAAGVPGKDAKSLGNPSRGPETRVHRRWHWLRHRVLYDTARPLTRNAAGLRCARPAPGPSTPAGRRNPCGIRQGGHTGRRQSSEGRSEGNHQGGETGGYGSAYSVKDRVGVLHAFREESIYSMTVSQAHVMIHR